MAGEENLLNRIRALVSGLDEAAWEALANKGLLRRARKDLEKGLAVKIQGASGSSLAINVPPFLVTIPASGPAQAGCTCPSPGVCQHIVAACLFLQTSSAPASDTVPAPATDAIRAEIASIALEQLKSWAGTAEYRAGVSLLESMFEPPAIEHGDTVLVRFMPAGLEARYVPGAGLDGMIVSKLHGKRTAVAAVLALRRQYGLSLPEAATQPTLVDITGAPRTRDEVLSAAASVMENTITVGLSHLSPVMADRLVTLSVSALGINLPRLALSLKAVADEICAILERHARADEARLLLAMARSYALLEAIRKSGDNPRPDLVGTQRAQYMEIPDTELHGVGAYPWQTASGYKGLTLLFWNNKSGEFVSWSEARPANQRFDPYLRFRGEGPWQGSQSPSQLASSRFTLCHARRTANGRLSSSTKTSAIVLGNTAPSELQFDNRLFTRWNPLRAYCSGKEPVGLSESRPLELVVVLQPVHYGARLFDAANQTFAWEVFDDAGEAIVLSMPFRDWTSQAIQVLEDLAPPEAPGDSEPWKFVARLSLRDGGLVVEPVSILRSRAEAKPVFHLAFDSLPQPSEARDEEQPGAQEVETESLEDEESERLIEEPLFGGTAYIQSVLAEINRRLTAIAETGCQGDFRKHTEWFERNRSDIYASGLTCMAGVLERLAKSTTAADILHARYLTHVHSHVATLVR